MKYKKQVRQESAVERLEGDVEVYQKRVKLQEEIKKTNPSVNRQWVELTEAKDRLKKSQITLTNTKRNLK